MEEWQDTENGKWKKGHSLSLVKDSHKDLHDILNVLYISGERQRKVPILITEETLATVHLLTAKHNRVDITKQNKFMFGRQYDSTSQTNRWQAVRSVAIRAKHTQPELITFTKIRQSLLQLYSY